MPQEVTSSLNRGPGGHSPYQAWRIRNQVSQLETALKKVHLSAKVAAVSGIKAGDVAVAVGGKGLKIGNYIASRHICSPKGKAIGPITKKTIDAIYTEDTADESEAIVCHNTVMPKYNVGAGFAVGVNKSNGFDVAQAARVGFKSQLPGPVDQARGLRMADKAKDFISILELEFQVQYGRAPDEDELKATVQLAIMNGFTNRNRLYAFRVPVNNDFDRL